MQYREVLRVVAELSVNQNGMFTALHARQQGVSHVELSRLTASGEIERLAHGVYKSAAVPYSAHDELRATWLSLEPDRLVWERLAERPSFATVSGQSAAILHEIGDFRAERMEFTTLRRKQTQRPWLYLRTGTLESVDVTIREGLPVTTVAKTLADLVRDRNPLDHVASALEDAVSRNVVDISKLAAYLAPLATRNGLGAREGHALLAEIARIVGM